jgi:hypothetical protein
MLRISNNDASKRAADTMFVGEVGGEKFFEAHFMELCSRVACALGVRAPTIADRIFVVRDHEL